MSEARLKFSYLLLSIGCIYLAHSTQARATRYNACASTICCHKAKKAQVSLSKGQLENDEAKRLSAANLGSQKTQNQVRRFHSYLQDKNFTIFRAKEFLFHSGLSPPLVCS